MIVPAMMQFLQRTDMPILQQEAAWCVTNFGCGNANHVKTLLDHGVLNILLHIIATSPNLQLKEQALWALSNMSSDEFACQTITATPDILVTLLKVLGICCPTDASILTDNSIVNKIYQFDLPLLPSLSTMIHITYILGYMIR